jgi:hypothetical protein
MNIYIYYICMNIYIYMNNNNNTHNHKNYCINTYSIYLNTILDFNLQYFNAIFMFILLLKARIIISYN